MATSTGPVTSEQSAAKIQALLNGPAGPPPSGVLPNFDNPDNMNSEIIFTLTFCMAIATIVVLMRMYAKLFLIRSMAYEDYTILLAWAVTVGLLVTSVHCAIHGGGIHIWNIKLETFLALLYWINANSALYIVSICIIKIAILLQYLRIFVPNRQGNMSLFVAIHVCMWSTTIFYIVNAVLTIVSCIPRQRAWNPFITGHCVNINALYQSSGVINVVSDFAILILPMKPIWDLQMPLRRKIFMVAVFATGALACATSIIRTYYSWQDSETSDTSYTAVVMGLWCWAEIAIGFLVSCVPVLPRFFQHFGPRIVQYFNLGSKPSTFKLSFNKSSNRIADKAKGVPHSKTHFSQQSDGPTTAEDSMELDNVKGLPNGRYVMLDGSEARLGKMEGTETPTRRNDLEIGNWEV